MHVRTVYDWCSTSVSVFFNRMVSWQLMSEVSLALMSSTSRLLTSKYGCPPWQGEKDWYHRNLNSLEGSQMLYYTIASRLYCCPSNWLCRYLPLFCIQHSLVGITNQIVIFTTDEGSKELPKCLGFLRNPLWLATSTREHWLKPFNKIKEKQLSYIIVLLLKFTWIAIIEYCALVPNDVIWSLGNYSSPTNYADDQCTKSGISPIAFSV